MLARTVREHATSSISALHRPGYRPHPAGHLTGYEPRLYISRGNDRRRRPFKRFHQRLISFA